MKLVISRAVLGLAAAATLTLAACSSGTSTPVGPTTPAPAAPPSSMMSGGMMSDESSDTASHNDADVAFAQQMIVHHQGAIAMADLAPTRADSQQVKDLAAQIKAAQAPEIEQMTGWLQAWGATDTDANGMPNATGDMGSGMSGMDHDDAPGMMSDDQMAELTSASGAEFDRLFLQQMIVHHQGAIDMADTEIAQGSNTTALTLAESIKTSQAAEIAVMQQLLQSR